MKERIWSKDWFAALAFVMVFLVLAFGVFSKTFQSLERYAYDLGVRARDRTPSDKIAVIAIDDSSIQNLGRWPWPRNLHAAMMDLLREGGAKAVGNTVFLTEAQEDAGLIYINQVAELIDKSALAGLRLPQAPAPAPAAEGAPAPAPAAAPAPSAEQAKFGPDLAKLDEKIAEARANLSTDKALADAFAKGPPNVLAMIFTAFGAPVGNPDKPLPDFIVKNALTKVVDRVNARSTNKLPVQAQDPAFPVEQFGQAALGVGHLNRTTDEADGAQRLEMLVLKYYDEYYPSLALRLAAAALNIKPQDIEVRLGEGIAMGGLEIQTTPDLMMRMHYYNAKDGRSAFPIYSFFDVLSGKVPPASFKDKVVIIGATAQGVASGIPTPINPNMRPVEVTAHTVSSILQQDFYVAPEWDTALSWLLILLIGAYLAVALPRLSPGIGAAISAAIAIALVVTELSLMTGKAMWLSLVTPAALVVFGHLFMTIKRLRLTEKLKLSSEAESAESNKMLGLAFQGQGQLDMAWEKFRRVQPADDKVLDLMYNLALDFERKRQFNKAESVFQHIAGINPKFRDIEQKTARAKKLSETVILGGSGGGGHPGGTMVLGGDTEKPMLGRYQVEKELGKGAMGVVYMGKDPKINRVVAIKTMALTQEFEPDELAGVKERFFREAETAGRLNHPNIVSIYDAGEEHDLCYIAMEFLKGHDLVRYTKASALMPVKDVMTIIADAADALDYAHQQGVVHRDIKPANLMWLEDSKRVKVTDFGIARITDSSKTKTGMVLGTPSYMSPEQLAGKKVDGRSDLFSLGVTLYQLLTGNLPFQADSMATLMFKIANEPHPQASTVRPDLPAPLNAIIDRALEKDLAKRYARGSELSADLRAAAKGMQ